MTGSAEGPWAERLPDEQFGWLARHTPDALLPFLRLARIDRPIGWWLLLLPCWWSEALACCVRQAAPNVLHLVLFLVGAVAMRGAGSTYNDLVDRDLDVQVARTRLRPIASGRVSPRAAKIFLVVQSLVGLAVLLTFNGFAIVLGIASLGIVAVYPFMKRVTQWPQAVLGLAFAWGGLMGWAVEFGSLAWPAVLIYAAAVFWTMGYDTIYALQDIADDAMIGIGSTAIRFGARVRLGVGVLYALAILCAGLSWMLAGVGPLGIAGLLAFAAHLGWQVWRVDRHDAAGALALFRSNRDAGLVLFGGLALQGSLALFSR